jgi:HAE1 family hydrophobic/amphiphilic exporter-1
VEGLYRSPVRVYLVLAILSLAGIFCALKLPISLFPNSSKPHIQSCVNVELSPDAFLRTYGSQFEDRLRAIHENTLEVETLKATYSARSACYNIDFKWGGDPQDALRQVQTVSQNMVATMPESYRDSLQIWGQEENSGFLALSFYSPQRSLTEVYDLIEPVLTPKLSRVGETGDADLYNPQHREVLVELKPESMAAFNLFPNDVAHAILNVFEAYNGGSLTVGQDQLRIEFPKGVNSFEDLKQISVATKNGRTVTLGDLAHVDLALPVDGGRIFKTSGSQSVLLWATPKPGGNVKEMAETVIGLVDESMKDIPKDITYKTIVDPSEFIRASVSNVAKEVAIAAGLAVFILFLFIGNVRNVATAAIEIPLSIVLAFIMMRLSGMNLNLISLGGLALSAGMNVDASVVVMENIFRHFDLARARHGTRLLTFEERLAIISSAVKEVRFAVIASTIASLVVFLPLAFTSALSYAILGDLAKAVVFSHGFSAIVALVLVPTIRLHLMKSGGAHDSPSILEGTFQRLELGYGKALSAFMNHRYLKAVAYSSLAALLVVLSVFVVPTLPREVIGKPDTDWLIVGMNVHGNTLMKQMESQTEAFEAQIFSKFGPEIQYTFTQINRSNNSYIMLRLKDKSHAKQMLKDIEEDFPNTPDISYWYDRWNPAELPLPNPPDFKLSIRGNDPDTMAETARDFSTELKERKIFDRVQIDPDASMQDSLLIRPRLEQWPLLASQGINISVTDLADLTRAATEGKAIGKISLRDEVGKLESMNVRLRFPLNYVNNAEELSALPVGLSNRIVPLKALASVGLEKVRPSIMRENGRELFQISATGKQDERKETAASVAKAETLVTDWPKVLAALKLKRAGLGVAPITTGSKDANKDQPALVLEDPKIELTDAIHQLAFAVTLSILLIFVVMVFQFGSLMNSVLVLVAIPLGFIGVVISLFVFQSTLSLNSLLGVILLNGIAVANSIILVDFLQRKVKEGIAPKQAAVEVAKVRLRPILMTSLTTGLGMLPVACGFGEGGKILQPLGIAVAGGLGFSVVTTLFIVPALQVSWLEFKAARGHQL